MANRKARRAKKRRAARVVERVKATPETLAKLRPWPMQQLLQQGAADGGIEADEFEAALQIVQAFKALTADLAVRSGNIEAERITGYLAGNVSDTDARRIALWFAWVERLPFGSDAAKLVEQIEDHAPISSVAALRHACHLWDATARDHSRIAESAHALESASNHQYSPLDSAPGFGLTLQVSRNLQTTQPRPAVTTGPRAALPMRPSSPFARNR
jgi:hypothetical protein